METVKKYRVQIILTAIGAIAGILYWHFVGCNSGSCPIFSRWHLTTLYGGFLGYFLGDILHGYLSKRKQNSGQN